jgi:hypothetical protein
MGVIEEERIPATADMVRLINLFINNIVVVEIEMLMCVTRL